MEQEFSKVQVTRKNRILPPIIKGSKYGNIHCYSPDSYDIPANKLFKKPKTKGTYCTSDIYKLYKCKKYKTHVSFREFKEILNVYFRMMLKSVIYLDTTISVPGLCSVHKQRRKLSADARICLDFGHYNKTKEKRLRNLSLNYTYFKRTKYRGIEPKLFKLYINRSIRRLLNKSTGYSNPKDPCWDRTSTKSNLIDWDNVKKLIWQR